MRSFRTGKTLLNIICALILTVSSEKGIFSVASVAGTASAVKNSLKAIDYRYFIAGGTCAAISHGITTPIDVVKTRIQANSKEYDKGMYDAAIKIIKTDGPEVLLGGLGPTVVGYGIEGAMKFGVYEISKPIFADLLEKMSKKIGNNAAASATNVKGLAFVMASIVAGAIAAILLCPMESTRIRIVTDPAYADLGLLSGFPKLVKEEGLWSSFSGIWAMLAKQVPYTFGKQVSFDVFATLLYVFFDKYEKIILLSRNKIKIIVPVVAAFIASIFACLFSQPGDMILTETYRRDERANSDKKNKGVAQKSFIQVVNTIYGQGGVPRFFVGTGARIVHVGLIITSQLVIYDIVKQFLGLPATGSH